MEMQQAGKEEVYVVYEGYCGNDLMFWRKGGAGYGTDLDEAEHWTEADAEEQCIDRRFRMAKLSDCVKAARRTVDMQRLP